MVSVLDAQDITVGIVMYANSLDTAAATAMTSFTFSTIVRDHTACSWTNSWLVQRPLWSSSFNAAHLHNIHGTFRRAREMGEEITTRKLSTYIMCANSDEIIVYRHWTWRFVWYSRENWKPPNWHLPRKWPSSWNFMIWISITEMDRWTLLLTYCVERLSDTPRKPNIKLITPDGKVLIGPEGLSKNNNLFSTPSELAYTFYYRSSYGFRLSVCSCESRENLADFRSEDHQ